MDRPPIRLGARALSSLGGVQTALEHLGHLHRYLFSPSSTNLRAVLVRRGAHGLPPHRYAMTLKRRSPGDMQAPNGNAVPVADWSPHTESVFTLLSLVSRRFFSVCSSYEHTRR